MSRSEHGVGMDLTLVSALPCNAEIVHRRTTEAIQADCMLT